MDAAAWTSAGAAALSLAGAVFAWWREHLSRRAKDEAIKARGDAQRSLAAAESQALAAKNSADAISEIAKRLAPPEIWLEWIDHVTLRLRTSLHSIDVKGIDATAHESPFQFVGDPPLHVTPERPGMMMYLVTFMGGPSQSVRLLIQGRPEPVEVPLPSGPRPERQSAERR